LIFSVFSLHDYFFGDLSPSAKRSRLESYPTRTKTDGRPRFFCGRSQQPQTTPVIRFFDEAFDSRQKSRHFFAK
jgi:hypothetical protein